MKKALPAILMLLSALLMITGCATVAEETASRPGLEPVKYAYVDPNRPYDAINYGLFDFQRTSTAKTPRGGEDIEIQTEGMYSIYIPKGSQPKLRAVIILVPDGTTAFDFARTETGLAWIDEAQRTKDFAVVFAQPQGGKWNTTLSSEGRDERAYFYDIFKSLRKKDITVNAYLSVDKSKVSIVGYREGADMAAVIAAAWSSIWPSTILIEPTRFEEATIKAVLGEGSYPHVLDNNRGYGNVKNGEIGMPMYIYAGENRAAADGIANLWSEINAEAIRNLKDTTAMPELLKVTLLDTKDPAALAKIACSTIRVLGYPGGTVRTQYDWESDMFETHNEYIGSDGLLRRWKVYVPEGLDLSEQHSMVVVLHGSSSAIYDIGNESRWVDVADKNGFVLLFIQGYPEPGSSPTSAPIPAWEMDNNKPSNKDLHYIQNVTERVIAEKNIDPSRVYLTGHSLGAMMITCVMQSGINRTFAAYAPVGMLLIPQMYPTTTTTETPCWAMLGEYDMQGSDFTSFPPAGPFGYNGGAASEEWAKRLGLDISVRPEGHPEPGYPEGKFVTYDWTDADGNAVLKYTVAMDSPHIYMAEEAEMIWDQFFSHIQRAADGSIEFF